MKAIFKFIFQIATDQLGLPIEPLREYAILALIGFFAFKIAYLIVGDMYRGGWIYGSTSGSFFHWLIRFFAFVGLWAFSYGAIKVYQFITANWQIILMIAAYIFVGICLCALSTFVIRMINKYMAVKNNA